MVGEGEKGLATKSQIGGEGRGRGRGRRPEGTELGKENSAWTILQGPPDFLLTPLLKGPVGQLRHGRIADPVRPRCFVLHGGNADIDSKK